MDYMERLFAETGDIDMGGLLRILRRVHRCSVCKKPAEFLVHNGEFFMVCRRCLGRVRHFMLSEGYVGDEIEDVIQRLVERYEKW